MQLFQFLHNFVMTPQQLDRILYVFIPVPEVIDFIRLGD